jgi:GNAT superfamily N-acetyltransferase
MSAINNARRLDRRDLPEVERHLLALEPADRRARFGSAFSDAAVLAYVRSLDLARGVLVGAVDEASGRILGLAEAHPGPSAGWVEVAVSVQAPHRRCGLGRGLVSAALAGAFERGAEAAEFLFAPGNRPIAGLVRALGARIDATLDRAEIRPPQPRQAA